MIKKLDKYSYAHGVRYMDHGSRNYDVAGYRLPSVTTILGKTKDTSSLDSWIASKGRKEAEGHILKGESITHSIREKYQNGRSPACRVRSDKEGLRAEALEYVVDRYVRAPEPV